MQQRHAGLYFDLPEAEYHADPALGSTDLKTLLVSGPDYWWRKHHPKDESTPYFEAGKGFHRRVLEGEQSFRSQFIPRPDGIPKLTEKIRAGLAPNGETILDAEIFERIEISAEIIASHPALTNAFSGGVSEVSVFWIEQHAGMEVPCKARFDYLKLYGIGDLKSISNPLGKEFGQACADAICNYGYHLQACHYLLGRSHMAELISHDLVWGDHDRQWLKIVAAQEEYGFQFVFVQKDYAPRVWTRSLCWGNSILDIAMEHRAKALQTYTGYMKQFGPDTMWMDEAEIKELDINELPRWFK
jgi:hypothetical protein